MEVAKVLKWWIEQVIATTEAFVSDDDIALGTRWSDRIKNELAETKIGIICVTPDNQSAPWISFEAGAISKAVDGQDNKVVPVLIDFKHKTDYKGPLSEFNLALLDREGLLKLAKSANASLTKSRSDADVSEAFDVWWPKLEEKLAAINEEQPADVQPERETKDIVSEVLDIVRDLQRQGSGISSRRPYGHTVEDAVRGMRAPQDDHMRNELTSHLLRDVSRLLHEFGVLGTVVLDVGHLRVITTTPLTGAQTADVQEAALNYLSIVNATSIEVDPYAVDTSQKARQAAVTMQREGE
ncbi:hypothetical protein AHiyo8_58760 [Arthrobacter sp. Hiyo8]|nr:hypothetical protein AHiyo8_58760 [Arthrobacter sp. Hiyo8]GAP57932.1 hypothetical protein AHiyo1_08940 [Arthrobacter sp. Hiyo1]